MAVKCVVVDKQNNKKQVNVNVKCEKFYKKCGFRSAKDFCYRHSWKVKEGGENRYLSIFAKNNGRANTENKCELPPPIDNELYFGSILIVMHEDKDKYELENLIELTIETWEKHYNKLYGGFDNLGEEDSFSSEEEIDPEMITKEGYSKEDGFVVESDEEIIDDDGEDEEGEGEGEGAEEEEYIEDGNSDEDDENEGDGDEEEESSFDSEDSYIASELEEEEFINTDED